VGTEGRDYLHLASGVRTYKGVHVRVLESVGSDRWLQLLPADGVFGLGIDRNASMANDTALDDLMEAVQEPIFTVWMQE